MFNSHGWSVEDVYMEKDCELIDTLSKYSMS